MDHFPFRNWIIVGSGSLPLSKRLLAGAAVNHVPPPAMRRFRVCGVTGVKVPCLIRDLAKIVETEDDILEEFVKPVELAESAQMP